MNKGNHYTTFSLLIFCLKELACDQEVEIWMTKRLSVLVLTFREGGVDTAGVESCW